MKKSVKFAGILAAALTITSLTGLSANAEERPQEASAWRESQHRSDDRYDRDGRHDDRRGSRRDDRDFLTGYVQRIDHRRGVIVLQTRNSSRPVIVEMTGRSKRNGSRGLDLGDLRRGDRVTFIGDWGRRGTFTAWRIDDIDSRGGRNRDRW